jgi:CRP-like cAMP-binding protein
MLCYAVGYGLMIFSGSLERYASVGIPSLLVGVCLVGLVVALWSSQQFCVARPDSNTATILAVSLASIGLDTRAKGASESAPTEASLRKMLAPHFHSQNLERLLFLLEPVVFEPGEVVLNRGERGDSLFFIEQGQLGVKLASGNGENVRLASYGPGTLVGQQAFFTFGSQLAQVVADAPTRAFRLTRHKLNELERTSPGAALELKTLVVQTLATRLSIATAEIGVVTG